MRLPPRMLGPAAGSDPLPAWPPVHTARGPGSATAFHAHHAMHLVLSHDAPIFGYPHVHGDRRNLIMHALTVPLFILGNCAVLAAPFTNGWLALGGIALTATAIGLQGRGHSFEAGRPAPFSGPLDAVLRILGEQWITFPRFVLSGGFSRAWRGIRGDR